MMTPYDCSVHTHTTLCDGQGTPEKMAAAAYAAGVRHYGFSGHSHVPIPREQAYVLARDMTEYRRRVSALRDEYAGRMEILCGIELDNLADVSPEGFDYWIGSVHDFASPDGEFYAVDYTPEEFSRCRDEFFHGDALSLAEGYYREVAEMASRKPDILGHIDLVTKYQERCAFFDEAAPRYRKAALDALRAADASATLLEINTGAMSRGWRSTPYPAPFLLKEWRDMGGKIIITADAHHPDAILYAYADAIELAKSCGYRESVILTRDGARECEL